MIGNIDEEFILRILSQEADEEEYKRFRQRLMEDEHLKKEYERMGHRTKRI